MEQSVNTNGAGSMTKAELVEEVSRVSDLTKKHSEVIVDTVFKSIIDALHRGEKIELRGFGSFRLRKREPRKGRNPKTGDKVDVPPKKVPAEVTDGAGNKREWQIGGPYTKEAGDFSSTQGQVLYVPDNKLSIDAKTKMPNDGVGVDRVTMIEGSNNCFTEKPEAPWWGGFRPDPTSQLWVERAGLKLGSPVAVARGRSSSIGHTRLRSASREEVTHHDRLHAPSVH